MQHACYVWRWHNDCVSLTVIGHTFKISIIHPMAVPFFLNILRLKIFRKFHPCNCCFECGEGTKKASLNPSIERTFEQWDFEQKFFLSKLSNSYGQHRCVTHLYGIPFLNFNYATDCACCWAKINCWRAAGGLSDVAFVSMRQRRLCTQMLRYSEEDRTKDSKRKNDYSPKINHHITKLVSNLQLFKNRF